jgi:glutathione S-transferase
MDSGLATWFTHVHSSKLPSVISRYRNEIRRVLGVLNTALEGKRYLVGDKVTIADLSFVPWHSIIPVGFI